MNGDVFYFYGSQILFDRRQGQGKHFGSGKDGHGIIRDAAGIGKHRSHDTGGISALGLFFLHLLYKGIQSFLEYAEIIDSGACGGFGQG